MERKSQTSDVSQEAVYGLNLQKEIIKVNNHLFLDITLAKKRVLLPLVNLVNAPFAIAWFDPSYERNPDLARLASETMAELLDQIKPFAVFTPPSSKSQWFIKDALIKSQQRSGRSCAICQLIGGTDFEETQRRSLDGKVITYQPVTGQTKYIGIPQFFNINVIRQQCQENGEVAAFVDDVLTTGATIKAMRQLTGILTGVNVVMAREATLDKNYPPKLDSNVKTAMFFPEIPIEKLDPKKLFNITDRQAIPRPIIIK